MNSKNNLEKFLRTLIILSSVILVIVVSFSFAAQRAMKKGQNNPLSLKNKSGEVRNNPPLPSQLPIKLPEVIYNLSGKVVKMETGAIVLNAEIFSLDEKKEIVKTIESRKGIIASSTKITRLSFVENSPREEKKDIKDIKIGDYVEVISDRDISRVSEFPVTEIRILP